MSITLMVAYIISLYFVWTMPQFKLGENVSYPGYGMGSVNKIVDEKINSEIVQYYELKFPHMAVEILVPVGRSDEFGLRDLYSKADLTKALGLLHKDIVIDQLIFQNLDLFIKEKIATGRIEDAIELINVILFKQKQNSKLSFNDSTTLKMAYQFVGTEVITVLGRESLVKYSIPEYA